MSTVVVHASKYGSAQRYAERIGRALGAPVVDHLHTDPQGLAEHDLVVFCAAIYGPSLRGSTELREAMEVGTDTRWVLVTVGLSEPNLTTKRDELVRAKFSPELLGRLAVVHLRGAMDRDALTFVDRSMMATIRRGLAAKSNRSDEEQAMLDVLEPAQVDFVETTSLDDVVALAQA